MSSSPSPNYYKILSDAMEKKEVCVGPFYGEFGHMMIHVLPFLGYLHSKGIKIRFCGLDIHQDICVHDDGSPLVQDYFPLPAYFDTGVPEMNDRRFVTSDRTLWFADAWVKTFQESGLPFFNLSDAHQYRFCWWPWWYNNKFGILPNFRTAFNPRSVEENAVAIYTRTKPIGTAQGGGPAFDISQITDIVAPLVEKIYVVGHPDQSHIVDHPQVTNIVTTSNKEILARVSRCRAVLSHNSGAAYVARAMRIPGIIFHNGELSRFEWTEYCSKRWSKSPLFRAENYEQIRDIATEVISAK